jgi:hypothetical protein
MHSLNWSEFLLIRVPSDGVKTRGERTVRHFRTYSQIDSESPDAMAYRNAGLFCVEQAHKGFSLRGVGVKTRRSRMEVKPPTTTG